MRCSDLLFLFCWCSVFTLNLGAAHWQAPPDLTIRKTHTGEFPIGFMGRYEITVSNAANAGPTTGPITLTDNLPANLGLSLGFGAGWTCAGLTNVTCAHPGPLAPGASLALQLSVTVGFGTPAGVNSITNVASVSTPGEVNTANNTASDPTTVLKQQTQTVITSVSPNRALNCAPVTVSFAVNNAGLGAAPRAGSVTVTDGVNSCAGMLNGASGSCALTLTTPGARALTAAYAGNADFNSSTSAPVTVQVNANTPPVLGTYPNTTIQVGRSVAIVPAQPPRDDSAIVSLSASVLGNAQLENPLSINPTDGTIFVTTAYPLGSFPVRVTATDDCGATSSTTFTINVACATINILPALLANAYKGSAYGELLRAENAVRPVKFSLAGGVLPPGLTLSEEGYLSGTPTANGTFTFTVKATDLAGCVGTREYTLDQSCKALTLNPLSLIDGREGQFYGQVLEARGGLWPYSFTLQSGALPPGVSFSAETPNYLSGTPTRLGSYTFVIKATDANGCAVTRGYTVKIECGTVTLNPATLREPVVGAAYSQQLSASGSTAPYTFSVAGGALPPGLSLSNSGLLAGTPTQGGTYGFTIKAVAANGCEGTQRYVVGCPTITVNPTGGNVTLLTVFTASGGVAPYTFSIGAGMLPYGLTFSSDGRFGGFPVSPGVFPLTIKATDANGCSGTNNYVLDLSLRPSINNLFPSAVAAGRGAFTLTINGGNILSGATLTWNGIERPATWVNGGQLRAEISAAEVAQAKTILLTVNNPPQFGGSPSQLFPFTIYPSTTRFEADVWPRPNADGAVEAADVRQLARYALKLDALPTGAEFQRADCAPSQTRGDGRFNLSDVVQAQHYAAGLGVLAEAGGPTATPDENAAADQQTQPGGQLTVSGGDFTRGQIGALAVQLNATGNETALSFTLHYDSARLTFLDVAKTSFFSNADVFVNDTQPGRLGVVFLFAAGQTLPGGPNPLFNLRFLPHGGAGSEPLAFSFSDELAPRATVGIDNLRALTQQPLTTSNATGTLTGAAPAFLSAASFSGGATVAPNSMIAAFGVNLATATEAATSTPLPTTLAGTTVTITDRTNAQHAAQLFFVSPGQINFLLPAAVAEGAAFVTIRTGAGGVVNGLVRSNAVAPGLFAAAANGRGLAAAQFLRVRGDGSLRYEPVARFDAATGQYVAVPFEFAPAGEEVFLVLYGTGLRGRSALSAVTATLGGSEAEVIFAGSQGGLAGLDQANVRVARTLAGRGELEVVLTVEGRAANAVRVHLK